MDSRLVVTVIHYAVSHYEKDSVIGANGRCVSDTNPPEYRAGDVAEIKKIGSGICCLDMAASFRNGDIGFGTRPEETYKNKVDGVFIRVARGSEYDIPLAYCPYCAAPVITNGPHS